MQARSDPDRIPVFAPYPSAVRTRPGITSCPMLSQQTASFQVTLCLFFFRLLQPMPFSLGYLCAFPVLQARVSSALCSWGAPEVVWQWGLCCELLPRSFSACPSLLGAGLGRDTSQGAGGRGSTGHWSFLALFFSFQTCLCPLTAVPHADSTFWYVERSPGI